MSKSKKMKRELKELQRKLEWMEFEQRLTARSSSCQSTFDLRDLMGIASQQYVIRGMFPGK